MPKALLVVERAKDVTHPDSCWPGQPCWKALPGVGVPLQTFLAPCLPKT